jgi:hypothetical protein
MLSGAECFPIPRFVRRKVLGTQDVIGIVENVVLVILSGCVKHRQLLFHRLTPHTAN